MKKKCNVTRQLIMLLLTVCLVLAGCGKNSGVADTAAVDNVAEVEVTEVAKGDMSDAEVVSAVDNKEFDYVATVEVTINPDLLLYIDADDKVVGADFLNEDAKAAYGQMNLVGSNLEVTMGNVIEAAIEKGFLKEGAGITINVIANKDNPASADATSVANIENKIATIARESVAATLEKENFEAEVTLTVSDNKAKDDAEKAELASEPKAPAKEVNQKAQVEPKKDADVLPAIRPQEPVKTPVVPVVNNTESTSGSSSSENAGSSSSENAGSSSSNRPSTPVVPSNPAHSDINMDGYSLAWEDNFDGTELNRSVWNVEQHNPGWVNAELQAYVDSTDNIKLENGKLVITPIKDGDAITSGRISTQNKKTFTYGMFEVRAKVPAGQGYLPAFWLMANDENIYGQWPRCGEIDCMEVMGQNNNKVYGTIHYGNPHSESQGTYTLSNGNFTDEYHTFTTEWNPGKITWYVDGVKYHEESDWFSTTEGQGTISYPAPFDQPFYIILNLAVGGSWVGNPDANTSFDNNPYIVDYVKVYQKSSYDENVTRPEKDVVLRDPDANGNYINNGDFEVAEALDDGSDWEFMTALGGVAGAAIGNGNMKITTSDAGTVDYSVQLVQAGVPFEKGATYELSFNAWASEARSLKTDVKAPDHGYMSYMPSYNVQLTTESQRFAKTFKMNADSDANGRLEFNMGNAGSTATIYIDDVVIKKIADADPNEVPAKNALSDGNYVYNGSFQEGSGHLGYWDISDMAKVSVTDFADGRRAKIELADGESVVLSQSDLTFENSGSYEFSYEAEASEGSTISIDATVGGHRENKTIANAKCSYVHKLSGDYSDKNVTLTITGNGTVYLDNVRLVEDSLIKNGSFNGGLTGFEMFVDGSAAASSGVDSLSEDNALAVNITNTGDADWKVQLKQSNVLLEQDQCYKLTFKIKSSIDRKATFAIQRDGNAHDNDWTPYVQKTIDLTADYQTVEECFKMNYETDNGSIFNIAMGCVGGRQITEAHTICIDDISLEKIDSLPIDENAEEGQELGVNLLSNADFSIVNCESKWADGWAISNEGEYTLSASDGAITFAITNVGTADWHVQLKQDGLSFVPGCKYRLTFDIESDVARTVKSDTMSSGYNWYAGTTFNLEADTKQTISYEINEYTNQYASSSCVCVSMGKIDDNTPPSTITISNIKLERIE